jgi:hypothetical protein
MSNDQAEAQHFYDLDIGQYLNYLRDSGKKPYPFVLIAGRRGLGKSFLARDIVWYFRNYEKVLCFCGSEVANGDWAAECEACEKELGASASHTCRIPPACIHPQYNPTIIGKVVQAQMKEFTEKGDACGRLLIILDDVSMDAEILNKCKTLKQIAMMGRHFKISCIVITQYIMDLQPKLRRQATMFFTLGETDDAVIKALKREFFSCLGTEKTVQKIMMVLTDDYGCMAKVDTSSKAIKDMVFRYKAKDRGQYQIGSKEFRNWVMRHTLTSREIDQRSFQETNKQKKGQVHVKVHDKTGRVYINKST